MKEVKTILTLKDQQIIIDSFNYCNGDVLNTLNFIKTIFKTELSEYHVLFLGSLITSNRKIILSTLN